MALQLTGTNEHGGKALENSAISRRSNIEAVEGRRHACEQTYAQVLKRSRSVDDGLGLHRTGRCRFPSLKTRREKCFFTLLALYGRRRGVSSISSAFDYGEKTFG